MTTPTIAPSAIPAIREDALYTRRESAAAVRLSVESLKRYEATGRLRGFRVGPKLVRYRGADLLALLK